jgi:hypothetical protein
MKLCVVISRYSAINIFIQNCVQNSSLEINSLCRRNYLRSPTAYQIFSICQIFEKKWEYNRIVCLQQTFIYLKGACDSIRSAWKLIILITLHLNAIYGKIPVGKGSCVTFPNDNLKKNDTLYSHCPWTLLRLHTPESRRETEETEIERSHQLLAPWKPFICKEKCQYKQNAGIHHAPSEIRTCSRNVEAVEDSTRNVLKHTFPGCCEFMAVVWLLYGKLL